ncbi:DUF1365 domain-containing protein [Undibacterium sp. CY18W]|uniref:DUF1365 domain-containing protein n=1 Tax=Undibacterium hunanense TaxID=2762292 RepID=A0ABR6ZRQ4_9BURK|nr:DUF1365 domain-containing protein [Undibacterium hunanense]MBC3918547.1 DUF1365 domain-containing protein [Undibacterium hunanense]
MTTSSIHSLEHQNAVLCTGDVMHVRTRPAKNAFRYGVFFMRIPLRALASGKPISQSRLFSINGFNLLSFHEKDHGDSQQALASWLDELLKAEGIQDANGEIWLQCFPRVLGYVFNPVSFWFCHRTDGKLRAIVCEVRNTFGEKHLYLLENGDSLVNGEELRAKKIFHVSPFCKVEGGYRFRFLQAGQKIAVTTPDQQDEQEVLIKKHLARIDYDDASGPLLLTSIAGIERDLTDRRIVQVMLRYPFMTLGVVLRIHLQALRLWVKRVPFISKPVPPTEELSR